MERGSKRRRPPRPALPPLPSHFQVFRRWDGQATLVANNLMAKKAIRNQWRSSAYLHHTMLAVSVETPMEKLDLMKAGVAAGMRVRDAAGQKCSLKKLLSVQHSRRCDII